MTISALIRAHEEALYRAINLVASENRMSPDALSAAASDLAGRYCIPPAAERPPAVWDYPNQSVPREVERLAKAYACQLFGGAYADCRPLSGNNAACIVLKTLVPQGGLVMAVPADCGGHFATEVICRDIGCELVPLTYDRSLGHVDVEASVESVRGRKVDLIFLDASSILFPHPLAELRAVFGPEVTIAYDASHVMGLIGGRQFQDPLGEGADLLQGSTHKTLFGPQKGLIVCRENNRTAQQIADGVVPLFVSNVHVHHIAALAVAMEEIKDFGTAYALQVIENAQALALSLAAQGAVPLLENRGFTASHQVILPIGDKALAEHAFLQLEAAGIHVNCIQIPYRTSHGLRLGTAELTRRGFRQDEMRLIGQLIAEVLHGSSSADQSMTQVTELSRAHERLFFWRGAVAGMRARDEMTLCAE